MSDVAVWIRRIRGTATMRNAPGDLLEIGVDDSGALKFRSPSGDIQAVDTANTQTVAGAKTFTGATTFSGAINAKQSFGRVTAASETVLATDSPKVYVDAQAADAATTFTLPAASTAGLTYTFVAGNVTGSSNTVLINVQTGDNVVGKTHGAENGTGIATTANTGIKNTAATNVVGDFVTLVSDGVTTWYMTAVAGVWASQ